MNTLGDWWNPLTWFDYETPEISTPSGAGYTGAGNDLFGFNFDDWLGSGASTTTIIPGVSDAQKTAWDEYLASGGVMEPNFNAQAGTTSTDIFGGIGDFFDSLSKNIPSLVGLGLNTWQNVEAILAQRLVRRVCEQCAMPETPGAEQLRLLGMGPGDGSFRVGAGCAACGGSGVRGRVGVYEMLRMTARVRRLVEADAGAAEIREAAGAEGMRSLWDDGVDKARRGLVPLSELRKLRATFEESEAEEAPLKRAA